MSQIPFPTVIHKEIDPNPTTVQIRSGGIWQDFFGKNRRVFVADYKNGNRLRSDQVDRLDARPGKGFDLFRRPSAVISRKAVRCDLLYARISCQL